MWDLSPRKRWNVRPCWTQNVGFPNGKETEAGAVCPAAELISRQPHKEQDHRPLCVTRSLLSFLTVSQPWTRYLTTQYCLYDTTDDIVEVTKPLLNRTKQNIPNKILNVDTSEINTNNTIQYNTRTIILKISITTSCNYIYVPFSY